jgi:hypothetical protein
MTLTNLILKSFENKSNSESLADLISEFKVNAAPDIIPTTSDRWLLASNLQKAIRRGLTDSAMGTASKLLTVDPRYFWRRLLVIAYEDVGYGNITLCRDLLKTFRREALCRDLGPERVAQFFAHELSNACKSRSLCDALVMLEFSSRREEYERQCMALTPEQLLATACDLVMPIMDRMAALRHICGYGVFSGGMYRAQVKANPDLMIKVCRRHGLNEVETTLFRSGQNVAESLNIPIPIISQMVNSSIRSEQADSQVFDGKSGVLFAALDRHTRAGKRCYARLAKDEPLLNKFFARRPALDPVNVLGIVMFIVEGAELDRWLDFDGAEQLRCDQKQSLFEYAGISVDDQAEILELVSRSQEQLNSIRAGEIGK